MLEHECGGVTAVSTETETKCLWAGEQQSSDTVDKGMSHIFVGMEQEGMILHTKNGLWLKVVYFWKLPLVVLNAYWLKVSGTTEWKVTL